MKEIERSQGFPHYNPMGAICCHGNKVLIRSGPKPNADNPQPQRCSKNKFDYDKLAGLRDIRV